MFKINNDTKEKIRKLLIFLLIIVIAVLAVSVLATDIDPRITISS